MAASSFPFMGLPVDIRLLIYGLLLPDRPIPARRITDNASADDADGGFQCPLRSDGAKCNVSILRASRQLNLEAEGVLYKQIAFQIALYGRSKFPGWKDVSETNFLGQRLSQPISRCGAVTAILQKVRHLNVQIYTPNSTETTAMCSIQDNLYDLVAFLRTCSQLTSLRLDVEVVSWHRRNGIQSEPWQGPPDWNERQWTQNLECAVFQLEPFQFIQGLVSAELATLGGWQGTTCAPTKGQWPGDGHLGYYKRYLEQLMTGHETIQAPAGLRSPYSYVGEFCDSNGLMHRVYGNIDRLCDAYRWRVKHEFARHEIHTECRACSEDDPALDAEMNFRKATVPTQYLGIPAFRMMWRTFSDYPTHKLPSYIARLPPNVVCTHQTHPNWDHPECSCGGTKSSPVEEMRKSSRQMIT